LEDFNRRTVMGYVGGGDEGERQHLNTDLLVGGEGNVKAQARWGVISSTDPLGFIHQTVAFRCHTSKKKGVPPLKSQKGTETETLTLRRKSG